MALHSLLYCSRSTEVTFVDAINVNGNVNKNKMTFSANDRVLIKLLRQRKEYGARKFIAKFPSKPWTLSELLNTGHLPFWTVTAQTPLQLLFASADLTKIWHIDCQ